MSADIGTEYPWLAAPWESLYAYLTSDRMPPALLLTGKRGLGKRMLARAFAQRLLCRHAAGEFACGSCNACCLVAAGTHPDLLVIEPEEVGKPIKVEAIRETISRLSLKPQYGGYRVVMLVSAQQMNRHAANSVLKTLEEPDAFTVFLLITDVPEALPVTVRSRCQHISVPEPPRSLVIDWLRTRGAGNQAEALCAMTQGAPIPALELRDTDTVLRRREVFESWSEIAAGHEDPVMAAAMWEKCGEELLGWLSGWVEDLIRIRCATGQTSRNNPEERDPLQSLAGQLDLAKLFEYLDLLVRAKRSLVSQINRQFLMEELTIRWSRLTRKS